MLKPKMRFKDFKLGGTSYYIPVNCKGLYLPAIIKILDDLGHPPDTKDWDIQPEYHGYYYHATIGSIIEDLLNNGFTVEFSPA